MRITRTLALCFLLSTCVSTVPAAAQLGSSINPMNTKTQLIDANGNAIDTTQPTSVAQVDGLMIGPYSLSSAGVFFTQDMTNYRALVVETTAVGSGANNTIECSLDGVTYYACPGWTLDNSSSPTVSSTNGATGVRVYPRRGRFMRVRLSTAGTGTTTVQAYAQSVLDGQNTGPLFVNGSNVPEGTASSGTPYPVVAGCLTRNTLSATATNSATYKLTCTTGYQLLMRPYSLPENDWKYASPSLGINNSSTAVTLKAGATSLRQCINSIQIATNTLGGTTEIGIRDGAGGSAIWRSQLQTAALPTVNYTFQTPICGTAGNLLEFLTYTAVTGSVWVNAQGYTAP